MRVALVVVISLALAASVAIAGTGGGTQEVRGAAGVKGSFNLIAMMHTSTAQFPSLAGAKPWDGRQLGSFAYRSIPCSGNAPVNNISSDLPGYGTRVAGSRAPSSTRLHPFKFKVVETRDGGREMRGSITLTVCKLQAGPTADPDPVPDESKPKIRFAFRAKYRRETAELTRFNGHFRIKGGTQRYDDLSGSGRIAGYLMCLGAEGCVARGSERFLDGQISLQGSYRDPTPDLGAG